MRLTRFTDNALRCLISLGLEPAGTQTVGDVATRLNMSEEHLTKVVQRLAQRGYVQTVRGRRGGVRLARLPAEISVGAVIRDCEDELALVPCFDDAASCPIAPACTLAGALDEALAAFFAVLDGRTLADLLANRAHLVQLVAGRGVGGEGRLLEAGGV
ncbi:MAG: Rrf2 family transcriptional regulator [Gemmatimonadetes bacterium]|nr:Rrf2 family transcriptional regulator [Gemmatimonadota bacterium]